MVVEKVLLNFYHKFRRTVALPVNRTSYLNVNKSFSMHKEHLPLIEVAQNGAVRREFDPMPRWGLARKVSPQQFIRSVTFTTGSNFHS